MRPRLLPQVRAAQRFAKVRRRPIPWLYRGCTAKAWQATRALSQRREAGPGRLGGPVRGGGDRARFACRALYASPMAIRPSSLSPTTKGPGRRLWRLALVAAAILASSSCTDEPAVDSPALEVACSSSREDVLGAVGLTETEAMEKARAQGLEGRITCVDGKALNVTTERTESRVNFELQNGRVISSTIG